MEKTSNRSVLNVSSLFYTIQGEGFSSGVPAYFIRLGTCNMHCGMSDAFFKKIIDEKLLEDGEVIKGDLHEEGKATWTCDSVSQYAWRGEEKDFQFIIDKWKEDGVYEDIKKGLVHIIWTGGEPTLRRNQDAIVEFYKYWNDLEEFDKSLLGPFFYTEMETNGTGVIGDELFDILDQINCSPKLSNNGQPAERRIKPEAIKSIMKHNNYFFKFVVSVEEDMKEILKDYIVPFNIPLNRVILMPGLDKASDFEERTRFCLELAKKYRVRGLTRLHIAAWNMTLNC